MQSLIDAFKSIKIKPEEVRKHMTKDEYACWTKAVRLQQYGTILGNYGGTEKVLVGCIYFGLKVAEMRKEKDASTNRNP